MNILRLFAVLVLMICGFSVSSQNSAGLAQEYFNTGEYEKAATVFKRLYEKQGGSLHYYRRYIECLLSLEDYDVAEKSVRAELKRKPMNASLYVTLGNLLERKSETEAADKEYRNAIAKIKASPNEINNMGRAFTDLAKFDLAIETYLKGEELLDFKGRYAPYLANLYFRKGDMKNMIKQNLLYGQMQKNQRPGIKARFQKAFKDEDYVELKTQLYEQIQENPDQAYYSEMLEWVFIQKKQYTKALRQAMSRDRLTDSHGLQVLDLAEIMEKEGEYALAIDAYKYVQEVSIKTSKTYIIASRSLLNSAKKLVIKNPNYTQADLVILEQSHEDFFEKSGKSFETASIMMDYAEVQATLLNNLPKAIELLNEVQTFVRLSSRLKAESKLQLGDYYLMDQNIWEATLLYSQVDKANKEKEIGEEARYRNARLSFFNGDFEWAQAQYDILKSATSKLISNDAIDQSVFITDNLGLDTTMVPLQLFAKAELLNFQNKYDEAFMKLDSILILFPKHGLTDDIAYVKAKTLIKQKKYTEAVPLFEMIVKDFNEDIRADNALFELAELYDYQLDDDAKAAELYKKLYLEFSNSTLAVEARKRSRAMESEQIQ